jgi:hypothetical protein
MQKLFMEKNMFATLSAEARIQAGLNELAANDLTTGRLAEYTGNTVSSTRLSLALSGSKALENAHGTLTLETLAELKDLVQSAHPLPISLKNVALIKKLLADRRQLQRRTPASPDCSAFASTVVGSSDAITNS